MADKKVKILVLFYSFTGNAAALARVVAEGAAAVANTEVVVKQIPEYLSKEFFADKPGLKAIREGIDKEFPVATVEDFVSADGVAIGTPTHFGSFAAQVKVFIDSLTPAWLKGKLVNKPAAVFCTAGSIHGGEEAALISLMIPLLNLGMVPIGIPYPIQGEDSDFDAGSPYGAVYVSGHKKRPLTEADKKTARILGMRLATMAHILNCGCDSCGMCHTLTKEI